MSNLVTDQLGIVQTISISCLPFMTQTVKPKADYSMILFHNGVPGDYIKPAQLDPNARIKAHDGDIIIAIAHTIQYQQLTGTIITSDNYQYSYEISIALTVKDPHLIAYAYIQEQDPVREVIRKLRREIKQYASTTPSDNLQQNPLPVEYWSDMTLNVDGFTITQNNRATFYPVEGPDIEVLKIQRDTELQLERLAAQHKIENYEAEQKRLHEIKENEFKRQESTKSQLYDICHGIRDRVAKETLDVLQARIHEGFAGGDSPNQISHMYFTQLEVFQEKKHIGLENTVIAAGLSSQDKEDIVS